MSAPAAFAYLEGWVPAGFSQDSTASLIKKGESFSDSPFFLIQLSSELERISPVEHYIHPVTADAISTTRRRCHMRRVANAQVMRRLVCASTQISRVVPQHVDAHVQTRRYHVPQIPFAQQDAITMELGDRPADSRRGARNPCRAVTSNPHLGALKMRTNKDRVRGRGRTGQESFRAPEIEIVADQPAS